MEVASVSYPFVRCAASSWDGDGYSYFTSWRPGVEHRFVYPDDSESVAAGVGQMLLSVVSRHKPGRFPERVFFTRQWVDPDGKTFGKGKLHICTTQKFNRLARGFQVEFTLDPEWISPDVKSALPPPPDGNV